MSVVLQWCKVGMKWGVEVFYTLKKKIIQLRWLHQKI
jgi:hypothetical protein